MTTFFLNRLATEPHALAFAGQSTPWPVALADQTTDPSLDEALRGHVAAAGRLLTPVAADLLATTGRPVDLFGFAPNPARLGAAADATASVEGVALTQLGALLDLEHLGYSVAQAKPLAVLGHSQGVLAVHMTRAIEAAGSIEAAGTTLDEILAVAALIAPELFRGEELYIEVETGGDYCRGATIADYYHQTGKRPNATVLLDVDRAGFVDLLVRAVERYGEGM